MPPLRSPYVEAWFPEHCRKRLQEYFDVPHDVFVEQLNNIYDAGRLATLGDSWLNMLVLESLLPTENPPEVKTIYARNDILARFMMALFDNPPEWDRYRNDTDFKHRLGDLFEQCLYLCANPTAKQNWVSHPSPAGVERSRKCVLAMKRWVLSRCTEAPITRPLDYTREQLAVNVAIFVDTSKLVGDGAASNNDGNQSGGGDQQQTAQSRFGGAVSRHGDVDVLRAVAAASGGQSVQMRSRGVRDVFETVQDVRARDEELLRQRRRQREDGDSSSAGGGPEGTAAVASVNTFTPGVALGAGGEGSAVTGTAEDVSSGDNFLRTRAQTGTTNQALGVEGRAVSNINWGGAEFQVPDVPRAVGAGGGVIEYDEKSRGNSVVAPSPAVSVPRGDGGGGAISAGFLHHASMTDAIGAAGARSVSMSVTGAGGSNRGISMLNAGAKMAGTHGAVRSVLQPSQSPAAADPHAANPHVKQPHNRPAIVVSWRTRAGNIKYSNKFFPCCGLSSESPRSCPHRAQMTGARRYHPGAIEQGRQSRASATKISMFAHWTCCQRPLVETASAPRDHKVTPEFENGCVTLQGGELGESWGVFWPTLPGEPAPMMPVEQQGQQHSQQSMPPPPPPTTGSGLLPRAPPPTYSSSGNVPAPPPEVLNYDDDDDDGNYF